MTTLADLITKIEAADLTATQRRDQVSAVRRVARMLGGEPEHIAADPAGLRRRLDALSPVALGLSKGAWANTRSLLKRAMAQLRPENPPYRAVPITPTWTQLLERMDQNRRIRMSPLVRHLCAKAIDPSDVGLDALEDYRDYLLNDRLRGNAEKTWDSLIWTWNRCVREVEGWPSIIIPREDRRERFILPWSAFPEPLLVDVQDFLRRQSGQDLSEDGPPRPLRPSSLKTRERQLRIAASALVQTGVDPVEIISIAEMLSLTRFRQILQFLLDRHGGETSAQIGQIAAFLKSVAVHWVRVDEATELSMKRISSRLTINRRGMTAKNRQRLRPLDDEGTVRQFVNLPQNIRDAVEQDKRRDALKAISAQMAAAIAILLAAPIRIANLAAIDMERHLLERNGRLYLVIPAAEVKNGEPVDFELPQSVFEILQWYATQYRPFLLRGNTTALFPGEGDNPKLPGTLGPQISREVFRRTGLTFNPHLFRHAAGKIFLDQHPGQYEVVRRVLGHKSIATTTAIYTGAETRAAGTLFASVIEELRTEAKAMGPRR